MIVGSVWTSGLAAVAVAELNLISLAFGVLFFAIGVDFGTHLGLRYMEQLAGATPPQAISEDDHALPPDFILAIREGASERGSRAQDRK